ncbi:MAG: TetR family transcriptional regulator [Acidimicrobiales bacterium]
MVLTHHQGDGLPGSPSLRERKKLATRRALRTIALDLVAERGFSNVTVEDIAEAADVSPRTFFNYFASKEEAILGADLQRAEALRRQLVDEPATASPLEALRSVLLSEARVLSQELEQLGGEPAGWLRLMKAAQLDPHLGAARAAHMTTIERAVAAGVAERLGTDPDRDPYPVLLASTAVGVMRAVISIWVNLGGAISLDALVGAAFTALTNGFPVDWELRGVVLGNKGRKAEAVK